MKFKREYLIEILIWLFLVGIFLMAVFSLHFYLVVHKNTYNLYFNDVDGIINGSPVRFMGIIVGHVRKLEYDPKADEIFTQIVITKKRVKIPDGSKAKVEFTGIVGSKSIEILPPQTNEPYDGIISENPIRISDFFDSLAVYNRALSMMKDGLSKFSNKNTELIMKKLSKTPDMKAFDEALDNGVVAQKKFNGALTTITNSEGEVIKKLDKIELKMEKLPKHKQKSTTSPD